MPGPNGAAPQSRPVSETPRLQPAVPAATGAFARLRALAPVDFLMTAAFALILVAQISRHDMWRDEIHSWGLVLASPTLADLFANLRFTGHPGLWYVLLWCASFLSHAPQTLQVVHAIIALMLIGAIGLSSPFSRLERLLLLCSYFVLFEYTVVSRNYGIGFLIALVYAQMRATRPDRLYLNACLLGLLANTNLFAFVLAGALAFEYLVDRLLQQGRDLKASLKEILLPAAIYAAFAAAAAATMRPSPDISWRTTGEPLAQAWDLDRLLTTLAGNVESLIPLHALNYWIAQSPGTVSHVGGVMLPALAFLFFLIFRDSLRLLIIPGLTAFGSIAVGQLIYANSIRHWGINFVALIAALWIQRVWRPQRSLLVLALLAVNAAAGIAVSVQQFPLTFSEGKHTADWIRENGLADAALVGTPDTVAVVVAQYLGKPIYLLDCSCTDTFLFYNKRRDSFDHTQVAARLVQAVHELAGRRIVFLITRPIHESELYVLFENRISLTELVHFDKSATDENFWIYSVDSATPAN